MLATLWNKVFLMWHQCDTVFIYYLDINLFCCQCESLQTEIEQLRDKVDELTVDLQIMKEDMNTSGEKLIFSELRAS